MTGVQTCALPIYALAYAQLRAFGFQTSGQDQVFESLDQVLTEIQRLGSIRQSLPFGTDGMVIKINDRAIYRQLGIIGKTPRAAVAFKYPAEEATTKVRDIVISIGRTGAATPVAILDPVLVAGSVVRHATLHNADEISRLDLRIGDTVITYKAGDIIPQIKEVLVPLRDEQSVPFSYQDALKTMLMIFSATPVAFNPSQTTITAGTANRMLPIWLGIPNILARILPLPVM